LFPASCRLHSIVVREPAKSQNSQPGSTKTKEKIHHEAKLKPRPKLNLEIQNGSRDCVVDFADSHRLQPQWMSATLADLPVLIQMALNISTIVTTLQSGQQISAAEAAAI
jgi:hypothetical protein